ncbi:MAG: 6-phospho-beta-glucosidase [Anaerocolumna sp.]
MKIVIVGAGSSYTPELIEGIIINHKTLPISEIFLVDIEMGKEKLDIIYNLSKRMVLKSELKIKISKTLNIDEALQDSAYVLTQLRVGQIDARILDEKIPNKYNQIGQETNGLGGMFKGLRTIPVIVEIADKMAELCPDAWLLNFTNPAGMVTQAVLNYSKHRKVIGLCNGPVNTRNAIAKIMKLPIEELDVIFKGSNHMVFVTDVIYKNNSILTHVIEKMNKEVDDSLAFTNVNNEIWNPNLLSSLQMIPSSYLKYYIKTEQLLEEQITSEKCRGEIVKEVEAELFSKYKDLELDVKPKELEKRGGALYSTAAINLINSLYNADNSVHTINVRNNGAVSNLDDDFVLEINCRITADGPIPLEVGELANPPLALVRQMKEYEVEMGSVALAGNYEKVIKLGVFNPLSTNDNNVVKSINELFIAHKQYLPKFSKTIEELENESN